VFSLRKFDPQVTAAKNEQLNPACWKIDVA